MERHPRTREFRWILRPRGSASDSGSEKRRTQMMKQALGPAERWEAKPQLEKTPIRKKAREGAR